MPSSKRIAEPEEKKEKMWDIRPYEDDFWLRQAARNGDVVKLEKLLGEGKRIYRF